jgi:hypothetical protein
MKTIPLLGKEGPGVVAVRRRYHPPPLPLLPLRRGVMLMAAKDLCSWFFAVATCNGLQRSFASLRMTTKTVTTDD